MNPPSVSECIARCRKFAEITGRDTALAMFYLQDADWDIYRSLLTFLREREEKPFFLFNPKSKPDRNCSSDGNVGTDKSVESNDVSEDPESTDDAKPVKSRNIESGDVNDKSARIKEVCDVTNNFFDVTKDPEPDKIRIMSWNIDGRHSEYLRARVQGVCDTISIEKPHVVLLQEAVVEAQRILVEKCPLYDLVPGGNEGYYTAILLRWDVTTLEDENVVPFYTSETGRNLHYVKCIVKGMKFYILNTHLESTNRNTEERKRQLKFALEHIKLLDIDRTVIFGGDLSLRDYELSAIGGLPEDVDDIWEVTGKRPETKFTWDVRYNDNLRWSFRYKPRCRFDRLYIRHSKPISIVKPVRFELVGLERLRSCHTFPSDHWGLLCHFCVPSRMQQTNVKVN